MDILVFFFESSTVSCIREKISMSTWTDRREYTNVSSVIIAFIVVTGVTQFILVGQKKLR